MRVKYHPSRLTDTGLAELLMLCRHVHPGEPLMRMMSSWLVKEAVRRDELEHSKFIEAELLDVSGLADPHRALRIAWGVFSSMVKRQQEPTAIECMEAVIEYLILACSCQHARESLTSCG